MISMWKGIAIAGIWLGTGWALAHGADAVIIAGSTGATIVVALA
jgi:hypothetical protein